LSVGRKLLQEVNIATVRSNENFALLAIFIAPVPFMFWNDAPNETVEKTKHTKQKRDHPAPRRGFFLGRALERGRTGSKRAYVSAPNT
jgi:hypothetical protein